MNNLFENKSLFDKLKDKDHTIKRLEKIISWYEVNKEDRTYDPDPYFCQECGKEFLVYFNVGFCSRNCAEKYNKRNKQDIIKCKDCNEYMCVIGFIPHNVCDICNIEITSVNSLRCINLSNEDDDDDVYELMQCDYDICFECAKNKVIKLGIQKVKNRNLMK